MQITENLIISGHYAAVGSARSHPKPYKSIQIFGFSKPFVFFDFQIVEYVRRPQRSTPLTCGKACVQTARSPRSPKIIQTWRFPEFFWDLGADRNPHPTLKIIENNDFQSFLDRWEATGAPPNAFKSLKTYRFL